MAQIFQQQLEELEHQHPTAMVVLLDGKGDYLYVNDRCRTILGYEPAEMIGQPALKFAAPEDIPHVELTLQDALLNGESVTVSIRVRTKTDELLSVRGGVSRLIDPQTDDIYLIGWVAPMASSGFDRTEK